MKRSQKKSYTSLYTALICVSLFLPIVLILHRFGWLVESKFGWCLLNNRDVFPADIIHKSNSNNEYVPEWIYKPGYDILKYMLKSHKNSEEVKKVGMRSKHSNSCYYHSFIQAFLSCTSYCDHIKNTEYDKEKHPVSYELSLLLKGISDHDPERGAFECTKSHENLYKILNIERESGTRLGQQYECDHFFTEILNRLTKEEEDFSAETQRFFQHRYCDYETIKKNINGEILSKLNVRSCAISVCMDVGTYTFQELLNKLLHNKEVKNLTDPEPGDYLIDTNVSFFGDYVFLVLKKINPSFVNGHIDPRSKNIYINPFLSIGNEIFLLKVILIFKGRDNSGHYYVYRRDNNGDFQRFEDSRVSDLSYENIFAESGKFGAFFIYEKYQIEEQSIEES